MIFVFVCLIIIKDRQTSGQQQIRERHSRRFEETVVEDFGAEVSFGTLRGRVRY